MTEWRKRCLGEITSFMSKGIPPKYVERENENTVRVLNQKCNRNFEINYEESRLHDCSKKKVPADKMLRPGDVLINSTGTGTAGRVAQLYDVPTSTTIDGHMILLRPTEEIDSIYYGYAVKAFQPQIETLAEGSTGQTEINRKRLQEEIVISFPKEKETQERIAYFLLNIDEKIKVNNKINKNLLEQAQAIYTKMFITDADSLWPEGKLSDLIEVCYGKDHKKLHDGDIPVYGSGGIMRHVDRALYEQESVLVPRKGTLNNVMYVNEPFWSVDTMFFTKMKRQNVAKFVFHFLKGKDLASMNAGSAVPSMTTKILNAIPLQIPDDQTLSTFEAQVSPFYQTASYNNKESENLAAIRDSLLPKLMSSEIDVSDIDL